MWAVAAPPQAGLTPMIPTPSVDFGIANADVVSRASVRGTLEPEHLVDQDHRDPPRGDLPPTGQRFIRPDFYLCDHCKLLPSSIYLHKQVSYSLVVAYASTFGTGRRSSLRSDPGDGGAVQAGSACL